MASRARRIYEFDTIVVDPDERTILKDGKPVQLSPRAFDVLVELVRENGSLLEKGTLIDRVWGEQFVEESNIQVQISAIRRALAEGDSDRYIETVPKRGYRFNAEIRERLVTNGNGAAHSVGADRKRFGADGPARTRWFIGAGLVLVLVIGFAYLAFRLLTAAPVKTFDRVSVTRLTDDGKVRAGAIAPDGNNVAFTVFDKGRFTLRLRNLPTGAEKDVAVPSENGFDDLLFSPDGEFLYYSQTDKGLSTSAYRVPILNGGPILIAGDLYGRVAVSPDGNRIAFIRIDQKAVTFNLVTAAATGGDERTIAVSKPPEQFTNPSWLDEDAIVLVKRTPDADESGNRFYLIEVDPSTGSERKIGSMRWQNVGGVTGTSDGGGVIIAAGRRQSEPAQLWYVDRGGRDPTRITNDPNDYASVTVDRKTEVIAAVLRDRVSGIWTNTEGRKFGDFMSSVSGTNSRYGGFGISIGNSGRIVMSVRDRGNWDIEIRDADSNQSARLAKGDFWDGEPQLTPDERQVVYASQVEKGPTHIWRVDVDGGNRTQLTNGFFEGYASLSPDGRRIYFVGGDLAFDKVWKIPIEGGDPVLVSSGLPVRSKITVSPDGKTIAFASVDKSAEKLGHRMFFVAVDGASEPRSIPVPFDFVPNTEIHWTPDGKAITYKSLVAKVLNLSNLPVDGSPPVRLTKFDSGDIYGFDWSPDGSRLAISRGRDSDDLVLFVLPVRWSGQ